MPTLAYVDPGSGLLIWQAVLAVMLGFVFFLKKTRDFLVKIVTRFFRRKP